VSSATPLVESIATSLLAEVEPLADEMTDRIRAPVLEFAGFDGAELWEAVRFSCPRFRETANRLVRSRAASLREA
jgi:hypothetical protein